MINVPLKGWSGVGQMTLQAIEIVDVTLGYVSRVEGVPSLLKIPHT